MTKSKTGNVLDYVLLKRVLAFAKPYNLQFMVAAISAILRARFGKLRNF